MSAGLYGTHRTGGIIASKIDLNCRKRPSSLSSDFGEEVFCGLRPFPFQGAIVLHNTWRVVYGVALPSPAPALIKSKIVKTRETGPPIVEVKCATETGFSHFLRHH